MFCHSGDTVPWYFPWPKHDNPPKHDHFQHLELSVTSYCNAKKLDSTDISRSKLFLQCWARHAKNAQLYLDARLWCIHHLYKYAFSGSKRGYKSCLILWALQQPAEVACVIFYKVLGRSRSVYRKSRSPNSASASRARERTPASCSQAHDIPHTISSSRWAQSTRD